MLCSALSHPTPRCFGSKRGCELNPTSQLGLVKWTRLIATSQAHPAFLQETFLIYKSGARTLLHACAQNPCPRSLPSLGLDANSRLQRAEGIWPGPMRVPSTYSLGPSRKRSAESCSKGRGGRGSLPNQQLPAMRHPHAHWGFPCVSAGKEFTCNAGDLVSIPGLGRSPGEGKGYPLQYSGLENSMDRIVQGVAKSRT